MNTPAPTAVTSCACFACEWRLVASDWKLPTANYHPMTNKRPNLILIMTDQQRGDTIACSGNEHIQTPNLDRLCATGVRFDRFYTEMPECVPSRGMTMTGQWGHRTGVMANGMPLAEGSPTFVKTLEAGGYHCQGVGKMHFTPRRTTHGFDHIWLMEEIPPSLEGDDFLQYLQSVGYDWVHEPHGNRHELYYLPQPAQLPDEHCGTTWVTDRSIDYLRARQNEEQPFFLFTSYTKPHPPFAPTIPFQTLYDPARLPLPVRQPDDRAEAWPLHSAQDYSKWMESTDDNLARSIKAAYYACITQIDAQIGRILDLLEETGQRDNTLIIFVSDHGELMGDHYHWGKRAFYEGAVRVPGIVSWPNELPQGETRQHLVGHRDLSATFLEAAGQEAEGLCGESMLKWACSQPAVGREVTFGELFTGERAIYMAADAEWKYAYMPNGAREQLFHLPSDPDELVNRADDEEAVSAKSRLRGALTQFFRDEGYAAALDGDELISLPDTPIHMGRNRQYARWQNIVGPHERSA